MTTNTIHYVGSCIVPGEVFYTHAHRVSLPEALHYPTFSDENTAPINIGFI